MRRSTMPWDALLAARVRGETRAEQLSNLPAAPDAIDLASQQPAPDLIPHDALRACIDDVLRERGGRCLGYAHGQGVPELREAIAAELSARGIPVGADDVVVTSGSQQAIDLVVRALVDPGDVFLVETASYPGTLHLLAAAGARVLRVKWDDEGPDLGELRRLGAERPKGLYLMPNFHNPLGTSISPQRREEIVAWSHAAGVPLIEDDYDADLGIDGEPVPPPLRALDADVCHIGTFSKKLIPALRVGYLVCPPALRAKVIALKTDQDNGTSALLQHALAEFLRRGHLHTHLSRVLGEYRARRDMLEAALRRELPPGITWKHPTRGLFVWIPLPTEAAAEAVYRDARRRGVLVQPSPLFISEGEAAGLRVTYCRESPERLVEGARRLGAAMALTQA
jgi:2-aminoadipate transaminase